MKVLLASPRGFCAGVVRAVEIVEEALRQFPPPIYVRKEIVHNKAVVEDLRGRGVHFVDEVSEIPDGAVAIFSAHGVSPEVRSDAHTRRLRVIDATCPLVTKVHLEVHRFLSQGFRLVLIGHQSHEEVEGTLGEAPGKLHLVETPEDILSLPFPSDDPLMILTQTTLSLDETRELVLAIKKRFPKAQTPPKEDICYATQNRQDAVKVLVSRGAEVVLVVGSRNSSNSQRLVDVARGAGARGHLIDHERELQENWLDGVKTVGVTAGASAPEHLVQGLLNTLRDKFQATVEEVLVREENIHFPLPRELQPTR